MTTRGERERADAEAQLTEYVARVVAAAPPLSEAPEEATAAIRAIANATRASAKAAS